MSTNTTTDEITVDTVYLQERLWTDTRCYEIVGRTPKGLRIRALRSVTEPYTFTYQENGEKRTGTGQRPVTARKENYGGNPYPCVWSFEEPDPSAPTRLLRLRKDGTYRMGDGSNPLRPCHMIDGQPVSFTDYRE